MPLMAGDFETITVSNTPIGLTTSKLRPTTGYFAGKKAEQAEFSVETNAIRIQKHVGAAPTASVGHLRSALDQWGESGYASLAQLRMIATAGDATVSVTYFYMV